ncbi:putative protein TPRXL [Chrysoperla carnea]|uniref:putative protein TPRXL n=1 Tax=Chrysoperla carnea TaxID=189513 RepID=UPI001D070722|nr:putative protein TPRXL [Chrysoperla carnea]
MLKVLIMVALLAQNIYQSNAAAACQNGQLYPHESECSKFYQCANGKLEEINCAAPLEFSTQSQTCTFAAESGCTLNKGNGGETDNNRCGGNPCDDPTTKPTCSTTTSPCSTTTTSPCSTTTTTPCSTTTTSPCSTTTTTPCSTTTTSPCSTTTTSPCSTTTTSPCSTTTTSPCSTTTTSPCSTTTSSSCSTATPPCPTSPSTPPPPPPCTDPPAVRIANPYPECPLVADIHVDVLKPLPKCCQFVHCDNFGVGHVKNCAPSDPPLVFSPCQNRCVWPWEAGNITCDPCTCHP